jgi:hypothetical protein
LEKWTHEKEMTEKKLKILEFLWKAPDPQNNSLRTKPRVEIVRVQITVL